MDRAIAKDRARVKGFGLELRIGLEGLRIGLGLRPKDRVKGCGYG